MNNRWKNAIYSAVVLAAMWGVYQWRNRVPDPIKIEGETMATTYNITYFDSKNRNFKSAIDSILVLVNQSINNYNPDSEVSVFNRSGGLKFKLPYLRPPVVVAQKVFSDSQGAFDPTVLPLVSLWGFAQKKLSDRIVQRLILSAP
jgi:thiamine biosynthesis lipoprotein